MINIEFFHFFIISTCVIATICGIISILLSIFAVIEVKSMQKSTHSIEYMPVDPNWASSDKEIQEFNENNKPVDDLDDPEIDEEELNRVDLDKMI